MLLFRKRRNQARAAARKAALTGFTVVDRRSPLVEITNSLLRKAFPDHWSFLLGELALYSLLVLVLTGSWLTLFFEPGTKEALYQGSYIPLRGAPMSAAYNSTLHITFDIRGGLLIRQMHHWASLIFVAAICVHMLRIFFTGSFRRPREINWMIGVALFFLAFLEGFCGYSLPDDLLSGTGLRTANTIVMSIPVLGTYLAYFLWDGQFPGQLLNNRLYILHVLFVPGVIIGLVLVHLILVVYLKHTQWSSPAGRITTSWVSRCSPTSSPSPPACSSWSSRCWPRSVRWLRSIRCGITGLTAPTRRPRAYSRTGTWAFWKEPCGSCRRGRRRRQATRSCGTSFSPPSCCRGCWRCC